MTGTNTVTNTQKHIEFTGETKELDDGTILHRIRATRDLDIPYRKVNAGTIGGWVENIDNVTDNGWVSDEAMVYGDARVGDSAWVFAKARVGGHARVCGDARVYGNAQVGGHARVCGDAWIGGDAIVGEEAWVGDNAHVGNNAQVGGNARIQRNARIRRNARVSERSHIFFMRIPVSQLIGVTFFRTEEGHLINVEGWFGTVDEFAQMVADGSWMKTFRAKSDDVQDELEALILLARTRITQW